MGSMPLAETAGISCMFFLGLYGTYAQDSLWLNGERCYLSPAVEAIVCHKHEILQLIPIEVPSMKGQDWLCLHIPLALYHLLVPSITNLAVLTTRLHA